MLVKNRIFILVVLCSCLYIFVHAQSNDQNTPKLNSPYSRLGIGDIYSDQMSFTAGMGGLTTAITDPFHANFENPAALGDLASTSFNFGLFGRYGNFSNDNPDFNTIENYGGNISELNLAFPIFNAINSVLDQRQRKVKWGMSIGIMPYSFRGYNILSNTRVDSVGAVQTSFKGKGGTYRIHWSNGIKYKNFNAGLTIGYFFGKNTSESFIEQTENAASNDLITIFNQSFSSLILRTGFQYRLELDKDLKDNKKNKKSILLGTNLNYGQSVAIRTDDLVYAEHFIDNSLDTISNVLEARSTGQIPMSISLGATYEVNNKMKLGVEITNTRWSKADGLGNGVELQDASRFALGWEYIPDYASYNKYWKQIRYRVGAFYEQDPRNPGEQLTTNGITLGFGFPIILPRQQTSFVNLSFAVGQTGQANLLQETYFKTTVGFTLNDNTWFFKRKFD